MVLRLFDVVSLRMVRKFEGHTDRITDLCFSEDGKWLLSSSMDGSLRIWNVILARQIDAIHVDVSIIALSLSPNLDILATSHVDQNGVYLWVNQAMFSASSNVDLYASGKEVLSVKMPDVSSKGKSKLEDKDRDQPMPHQSQIENTNFAPYSSHQIPDLVTLSLLPKSQWQSLVNLDIIKVRNKPIEPPKKPEKAPFFLASIPTLSGEILFKPSDIAVEERVTESGELVHNRRDPYSPSQFLQLLQSSSKTRNFSTFTEYIKVLSPSTLDMELRMLQIIDGEYQQEPEQRQELHYIELLIEYFVHEITCRNNFEFIQAVLTLFLKIHGETVRCQLTLHNKAKKLLEIQSSMWQGMDKMFQSARCMVGFLSNSQF